MPQSLFDSHQQIDSNLEDLLLRLSSFKKEIDKNSLLKLTNLLVRYLRAVKNKHFLVEEIELFPSANLNPNDLERLLKDHQEIYSKLQLLEDNLRIYNHELDAKILQEKILFVAYNLISTIRHHAQREDLMFSYYQYDNLNLNEYLECLKNSYQIFFNQKLDEDLYTAPYVIASHSNINHLIINWPSSITESQFDLNQKPVFVYANLQAQKTFEYSWQELVGLESALSAEQEMRSSREELLANVNRNGFIDNYSGIRITKSGKRFEIKSARVWQVLSPDQKVIGQAVKF